MKLSIYVSLRSNFSIIDNNKVIFSEYLYTEGVPYSGEINIPYIEKITKDYVIDDVVIRPITIDNTNYVVSNDPINSLSVEKPLRRLTSFFFSKGVILRSTLLFSFTS